MTFQFDFNDTFEGGVQDGTYEVAIYTMNENATQGGSEYIDLRLVIRNDIDQKGKNQLIFHRIWKTKATGKYNKTMINTIGKAAKMDANKEYNSLQDVFDDLVRRPLKVTVKNEKSEYNGNEYTNLNVKTWAESMFPDVQHVFKTQTEDPFKGENKAVEVSGDDLPF